MSPTIQKDNPLSETTLTIKHLLDVKTNMTIQGFNSSQCCYKAITIIQKTYLINCTICLDNKIVLCL